VSYKRQALLILCVHLGSPMVFGGVSVAHLELFSSLCCVFVLFVFVLCLVCPMLPVSLDCPFLIAPSIFSNVYLFVCLFVCLRAVSCVPNVPSVCGLSILDCPFGFL
jgi:hypothetical protein